ASARGQRFLERPPRWRRRVFRENGWLTTGFVDYQGRHRRPCSLPEAARARGRAGKWCGWGAHVRLGG
ncbi:unnamed protein product, partial [Ectocarpus sp. 13 AM-2016]